MSVCGNMMPSTSLSSPHTEMDVVSLANIQRLRCCSYGMVGRSDKGNGMGIGTHSPAGHVVNALLQKERHLHLGWGWGW